MRGQLLESGSGGALSLEQPVRFAALSNSLEALGPTVQDRTT
jgi:hypothetical protein